MRFTTILGVALVALSTAAVAQIASSPSEQKVPVNGATTVNESTTNDSTTVANDTATNTAEPVFNTGDDIPVGAAPGDPVASTSAPPKLGQSAKGSRTNIVSARSGLVDTRATGQRISSSTRRMYLIVWAGRSAQLRAPAVDCDQPVIDS